MQKLIEFFEKPENGKRTKWTFFSCLIILVVLDLFVYKHPHFSWEMVPGFYAIYGFIACVLIVAVSKTLGKLWLQRREDYYD